MNGPVTNDRPCVHHWKISSPTPGTETVNGTCLKCGASRVYRAWIPEIENVWEGSHPLSERSVQNTVFRRVRCIVCGNRMMGLKVRHGDGLIPSGQYSCAECGTVAHWSREKGFVIIRNA